MRLAAAPISWGICEVPGWGHQLAADRVFGEMAALGVRATELGPIGYLPFEPAAIREQLDRHGLQLVGGFVPLVLHEPELDSAEAERVAAVLAAAGAEVFNAALVADTEWSAPRKLDDDAWNRLAHHLREVDKRVEQHGLTLALHPHVGTQVETAADVERALALTDCGWCLDTGHLLIGGVDPAEFARRHGDRIVHVHLKDVDMAVARRGLSLVQAVQAGLFRPLGAGDVRIDEVLDGLDGYARWLVLEQDTALTGEEPPVGSGPVTDVRQSIEYLQRLASTRRERVAES
ncbi:MAG TPA: TIM barrel protein [Solirubrobacteraceae bacterium]|nr:TIM barrel protein [Solirubrobacteraceae bacterium]